MLNRKTFYIIAQLLNIVMIVILAYVPAYAIDTIMGITPPPAFLLCFVLLYGCGYLLRTQVQHFWAYILLHLLLLAGLMILPLLVGEHIMLLILFIGLLICDIAYWQNSNETGYSYIHPVFVLVFLVVFILAYYYKNSELMLFTYRMCVLFLGLFLLRLFFENSYSFSTNRQLSGTAPIAEMMSENMKSVLPIIFVFSILLLFLDAETFGQIVTFVFDLFKKGLRELLRLLAKLFHSEEEAIAITESGGMGEFAFVPEPVEDSIWKKIFDLLFYVCGIGILVFVAVNLLRAILRFLLQFAFRAKRKVIIKEDYVPTEEVEIMRSKGKATLAGKVFLSNREKIRKYYRQMIKTAMKQKYKWKEAHTPIQTAEGIDEMLSWEVYDATKMYEKARYGCVDMEDADVSYMKKKIKKES